MLFGAGDMNVDAPAGPQWCITDGPICTCTHGRCYQSLEQTVRSREHSARPELNSTKV
jgi:hypothetical protein